MTNAKAYIPIHAFQRMHIESMLNIAFPLLNDEETQRRLDYHHSRRTMLYFLLAAYSNPAYAQLSCSITAVNRKINQEVIEKAYNHFKQVIEPYQIRYRAENLGAYWELQGCMDRPGPKQSQKYISQYRQNGFDLTELKIYWNYREIENLHKQEQFNPVADADSYEALNKNPVKNRNNSGKIEFVKSGIEDAVHQVPTGKQVIVLDFADERMPGGYFLENARTQEEVILYNSDCYRALLDLKYMLMDGGYILPEYGLAYIKRVRFFQKNTLKERVTDVIVAACYDLSGVGEGIYKPPLRSMPEDLVNRTRQKFQAIIASAVANTEGNGENTYLLLGPIGTGAFGNDMQTIAKIFSQILSEPLMNSDKAIRFAFDQIWFVSTDSLDRFAQEFPQ